MKPNHLKRWLYAILAIYVVLASIYSIVTPIFEASDELWHYPMVQYLATHGLALPPQTSGATPPSGATTWRQEGSQPPLYYLAAAVITAPIDTSDLDLIRRQNPHADIGTIRPDGNVNMIVHHAALEAFPWHRTTLAVHVARFFSVLLGLGTVLVTYRLGRELFPRRPEVALGAAALNACLPMFLFISGSVNNDNLSNLLGNLLLLLIVLLLKAERPPRLRFYALIGVVAGASLLAKLSLGLLIPLVALALLITSLRWRDWRPLVIGGLISGALTIAIAGWWYLRNAQLYGDPTGLNTFLEIVGRRTIPANAAQLWAERDSFTRAFWGFFGGVNVPLPDAIYLVFNIIGGSGIIGATGFTIITLLSVGAERARRPYNVATPCRYLAVDRHHLRLVSTLDGGDVGIAGAADLRRAVADPRLDRARLDVVAAAPHPPAADRRRGGVLLRRRRDHTLRRDRARLRTARSRRTRQRGSNLRLI